MKSRTSPSPTPPKAVLIDLPIRIGSPMNGPHGHWSKSAKTRKEQRQIATWASTVRLKAFLPWLRSGGGVTVTLVRQAPQSLDGDNLQAGTKAIRDAVADSLGLKTDRDPHVTWIYQQEHGPRYGLRISVESSRPHRVCVVCGLTAGQMVNFPGGPRWICGEACERRHMISLAAPRSADKKLSARREDPWICEEPARRWSFVDARGRRWAVYRHDAVAHGKKGWWYASLDGEPVFSLAGKRPQYWAFLSKALKDVLSYSTNPRWATATGARAAERQNGCAVCAAASLGGAEAFIAGCAAGRTGNAVPMCAKHDAASLPG